MASIEELTRQSRAAILADIMDAGRAVTPEQYVARDRIAELETALTSLRLTARVLLQNAEGCAVNHYGEDFQLHGEPGWLRDSRRTIEAAEVVLGIGKPTA